MDKTFLAPVFSPKVQAYIEVYDKLKNVRLKKGIFPPDHTRQVNEEIGKIRKRILASIARIRGNEGVKKLCEKDPEFAKAWDLACLKKSYLNAVSREAKLHKRVTEVMEQNENSSTQN